MYKSQINLYAWNKGSNGASELAEALGIKRIKHERSTYIGKEKKIVINWGSSEVPNEVLKSTILNHPDKIKICANKKTFFETLADSKIKVSVPDWTTDDKIAFEWVSNSFIVCARTILNGHSAAGLVLMNKDDIKSLVKAPLYTKYIPKRDEFRVHIFKGKILDIQKKSLRKGWIEENGPDINFKIRNLANGFVYIRNDIKVPNEVTIEAINAINAIDLDFGAVDVIFNEKKSQAYVLEINTAPGLEGTTIENYANAFKNFIQKR